MPNSIKIEQNVVINPEGETALQTAITGNTVYSLPKWTGKQNMVDLMLKIMDDDGPLPMLNMRPTKKMRNAADQFDDEHHGEYEAMGQGQSQVERVHNHNKACPKMYDELDRRRSIARVGMTAGLAYQTAARRTPSSSENKTEDKFDSTCPTCVKRKKRNEDQKRRRRLCKKCREEESRKESKNNLGRVDKQKNTKPGKRQTRSFSRALKPSIVMSNKGFQCHLTAKTKSVSTSKSADNLSSVISQDITIPNIDISVKDNINQEKIVLKSKSSHKKKVGRKPASIKSDVNSTGQPDTENGTSRTSYNSFVSMEHEPMVE